MDEVRLTAQQRELLLYHRLFPADSSFTLAHLEVVRGDVDLERLRDALEFVLAGSTGMNLVFVPRTDGDGDGDVAVRGTGRPVVPIVDAPAADDEAGEQRLVGEEVGRIADEPRPPERWPAYDVRLYRGRRCAYLAIVCSHLVTDAVSMFVIAEMASKIYNGELTEDYVEGLRHLPVDEVSPKRRADAVAAFRELMQGVTHVHHEELAVRRAPGGALPGVTRQERLPAGLDRALRRSDLVREAGPYTVFVAAYALVLASLTGRSDVTVGVPVSTRRNWRQMYALGYFITTLPLPLDLDRVGTFAELCTLINSRMRVLLKHRAVTFGDIAAEVLPRRGSPHLDNAVTYYRKAFPLDLPGCTTETLFVPRSLVRYPLTVNLRESDDGFVVGIDHAQRFAAADPLAMLLEVVRTAVGDPDVPLAELRVISEHTERGIDRAVNRFRRRPVPESLDAWFGATAQRHADRVAVSDPAGDWTYAQLDDAVSRVAAAVEAADPGPYVAVAGTPGRELVAVLLGVLRSGRAYVPIDAAAPSARTEHVLGQFASVTLVAGDDVLPAAPVAARLRPADLLAHPGGPAPARPATADDLAYVIFTSGSTGVPKGVQVTHRNVMRLFSATAAHFDFDERDVWCLFHSYAFDFSVWEIFGALLTGGRLVVPDERGVRSPTDFAALLADRGVTVLNQTPSAFRRLGEVLDEQVAARLAVRWVVFGGEALHLGILEPWVRLVGARARLVNMYGITESTVHTTFHEIAPDALDDDRSVIGRPLDHLHLHVVDRHLNPCPVGVPGEILVAGDGVARGYLGDPELTARRFPAGTPYGPHVYRSGDRGYVAEDGTVVYLDRIDRQVQLRGHRIEPGEVETALRALPGVAQVHVGVHRPAGGEPLLAAWIVPDAAATGGPPTPAAVRGALAASLPHYMVPAVVQALDRLPMTANGKVDVDALPPPARGPAPPPDLGDDGGWRAVAAVWAEVIGIDAVGPDDTFFEVGGTSMHLVRTHRQLVDRFGTEIDVVDIFEYPTPRLLAAKLGPGPGHTARPGSRRAGGDAARRPVRAHRGRPSRDGARR